MTSITVNVENSQMATLLRELLRKISGVSSVTSNTGRAKTIENTNLDIPDSKFKSYEDLMEGFGMWKGKDISLAKIRSQAWPSRKK